MPGMPVTRDHAARHGLAAALCAVAALAPWPRHDGQVAPSVGPGWSRSTELLGSAPLNRTVAPGSVAGVTAVSCPSALDCEVAGSLAPRGASQQPFVAAAVGGVWHRATLLGGFEALDGGNPAILTSLSCVAAGDCTAAGWYESRLPGNPDLPFVVADVAGRWRAPVTVPGARRWSSGGAQVGRDGLSCSGSAPGDCSLTGTYATSVPGPVEVFVSTEVAGRWGPATTVPRLRSLNRDGDADAEGISCAAPGDCAVVGYTGARGGSWPFEASEVDGSWEPARLLTGDAGFNAGSNGSADAVACTGPGDCVAGGSDEVAGGAQQAFVVEESAGTWGAAEEVPGSGPLDRGRDAQVSTIACAATGECLVAGTVDASSVRACAYVCSQLFVTAEAGGAWGLAALPVDSVRLNTDDDAEVGQAACWSAGDCELVATLGRSAVTVGEGDGTVGAATVLPGSRVLSGGADAGLDAVACATDGYCVAGGAFTSRSGQLEALVDTFASS